MFNFRKLLLIYFTTFIIFDIFVVPNEAGLFSGINKVFKKIGKSVGKIAKKVGGFAGKVAPLAALIPGIGPAISAGLASVAGIAKIVGNFQKQKQHASQLQTVVQNLKNGAIQGAYGNTDALKVALKQVIDTRALQKSSFSVNKFLSQKILTESKQIHSLTSQNAIQLGTVGIRTAEIDNKLNEVLADNKRQEVIQLQTIQSLKSIDGTVQSIDRKADQTLAGIFDLDADLGVVQATVDRIDHKMDKTNAKLDSLAQLSVGVLENVAQINASIIRVIIEEELATPATTLLRSATETQTQITELSSEIADGFNKIGSTINGLSAQLIESVEFVDGKLDELSDLVRDGFATVIQGQLEQDTKSSRECYRRLKHKIFEDAVDNKPMIHYILNPALILNSPVAELKVTELAQLLMDSNTGVEHCWQELVAVYNPADAIGISARTIFDKLKDLVEINNPTKETWLSEATVAKFKSLQTTRDQIMMMISDLFTWKSIGQLANVVVAIATDQAHNLNINEGLGQALDTFLTELKVVDYKFDQVFPLCSAGRDMRSALSQERLICDDQMYVIDDCDSDSCFDDDSGFQVGTICQFVCIETQLDLINEKVICGPGGEWSMTSELDFKRDYLHCVRQSNGNEQLAKAIASLKNTVDHVVNLVGSTLCPKSNYLAGYADSRCYYLLHDTERKWVDAYKWCEEDAAPGYKPKLLTLDHSVEGFWKLALKSKWYYTSGRALTGAQKFPGLNGWYWWSSPTIQGESAIGAAITDQYPSPTEYLTGDTHIVHSYCLLISPRETPGPYVIKPSNLDRGSYIACELEV